MRKLKNFETFVESFEKFVEFSCFFLKFHWNSKLLKNIHKIECSLTNNQKNRGHVLKNSDIFPNRYSEYPKIFINKAKFSNIWILIFWKFKVYSIFQKQPNFLFFPQIFRKFCRNFQKSIKFSEIVKKF